MSFLGSIAPNLPRSQSVVSHNLPQAHGLDENDDTYHSHSTTAHPGPSEKDKSEDGETLHENESDGEARVTLLARQLTRHSTRLTAKSTLENPFFLDDPDSTLNPNSPNFRVRDWMKMLLEIRSRDPERYPDRTAGVAFKNLSVHGFGSPTDYQKDVMNVLLEIGTIARRLAGIKMPKDTYSPGFRGIGISPKNMQNSFRGEAIYTAENDIHFPQLSVGDTLMFAAIARAPRNRLECVSQKQHAEHMRDVVMAMLGLSHTINTRVGNDFIRGVRGGERKWVSIAEATLSQAPLQCWDNSTRGLDSANALEFCKNLAMMSKYTGSTACVAIYQASQSAYDVFNKVTVLYEGRQIYFGNTKDAKKFFVDMGFDCPERQTTADFLTSLTSPAERLVRPGYEDRVPRTPDEFAAAWKRSEDRAKLMAEIEEYERQYPIGGPSYDAFVDARKTMQSKRQRVTSPYTISIWQQVSLCVARGFQRLRGDFSLTATALIGNFTMALIIGSVFFNLPDDTSSFYYRGALLFFAVLLNAFSSALEILTLYSQRPIVEKQSRYAFYHPFAEAVASMLCDTPYKLINSFTFNVPLYLMTNLRRDAAAFFTFWIFSVVTTFTVSMIFRTIASTSRSLSRALVPAAILILGMVIYTGFTIPTRNMLGWSRWMNYINPIAYSFESFMVNEFDGRQFECISIIPSGDEYNNVSMQYRICSTVGAESGPAIVDGGQYVELSYQYTMSHLWRNMGILIGFMQNSKGEVLLFRRGRQPDLSAIEADPENPIQPGSATKTEESAPQSTARIQRQTAIFHWEDVCYDIKIKGQTRRILDNVDGWVKPGTCTALMGVSGAGKTTLLDVLATRVTMGVVSGSMLVDGRLRDQSFQRKTGYVQQQDLHLATSTVREALRFSAILRQPTHLSRQEKLDYVEEVIKLLGMEAYADAIVGVPGEGLNVEQRKRLTIGVELAAKPQLLLFLDEPTSGLDSQTSWFDRLLLLASGGKTIDFGEIGPNSSTLSNYFVRNRSHELPPGDNPAEWMLEVIGAAPGSHTEIDWVKTWRESPEYAKVKEHLAELRATLSAKPVDTSDPSALSKFAAPFSVQLWECPVTQRSLYEARERPSKAYSWKAFMAANIIAELPWNSLMAAPIFFCWYYPIRLYNNAKPTDAVTERGGLMFLLIWTFLLFTSTLAHMIITSIELAETAGNVANLLFSLYLIFCGVLSTPDAMPGFWIFMYRGSPFTYLVSAMLSTGLSGTDVECEPVEYLTFAPPDSQTCGDYMQAYIDEVQSGYLLDPDATSQCSFCSMDKTDTFLLSVDSTFDEAWRNFGLMWFYILFNIADAVFIYWLARVPKGKKMAGKT
ncbi:hypothetical protein BDW72DRAFT_200447 [Aspergillus terricola var. indicus]